MENLGRGISFPPHMGEVEVRYMVTVSSILEDINRGCAVNNMIEQAFSYRVIYFVNFGNRGEKHYIDTSYANLRDVLENIIRRNLTTTNSVVLAAVTVKKDKETISLLSKAYPFSLDGYFEQICCEVKEKEYKTANYGRRRVQWG